MDILYVLGNGSKWSNNELRYSLRSVERFCKNVGRIYVCGSDPGFLSNEVRFVPCEDTKKAKHKNIIAKIEKVIKETCISDEFLLSSDDHFFIDYVDLDKYPYYSCGELPKNVLSTNGYDKSLFDTRVVLTALGLPCKATNPHLDTHIRKDLFAKTEDIRKASELTSNGYEINCILGNMMIAEGVEFEHVADCKIRHCDGVSGLKNKLTGRHCFSIADSSISEGVGDYLKNLFPRLSKYECV